MIRACPLRQLLHQLCICRPSNMPRFGLGCCDRCHRLLFEYPIIFWTLPAGTAHSMRASAQVTAPGAVTSRVVAMSTRPNRQNRSTCSRMSVPSQQKQKLSRCHVLGSSTRILEANREKWVNDFTLRMIIILMETIKDPYYQPARLNPFFIASLTPWDGVGMS
jgi:hypothetical protein